MGIAFVEAARLAEVNRARYEELADRHRAVVARVERERYRQDARRRMIYDAALVPFRDTFARLKGVELAGLADVDLPAPAVLPAIELVEVRLSARGVLGPLAGGLTAGAGASTATAAGVAAFATASTGAPIAALSGVAASNATLAWLGGGTLAAGGGGVAVGTIVMGGLVAGPAVLVATGIVSWQGRRRCRTQQGIAADLTVAEARLALDEQRSAAVITHGRRVRELLADLQRVLVARVQELTALVDDNDDYPTHTPEQRRWLASLVGLVTVAVAVLATPLADDSGAVGSRSEQVVADARRYLAGEPEPSSEGRAA